MGLFGHGLQKAKLQKTTPQDVGRQPKFQEGKKGFERGVQNLSFSPK
jgi:hypothetical protein